MIRTTLCSRLIVPIKRLLRELGLSESEIKYFFEIAGEGEENVSTIQK